MVIVISFPALVLLTTIYTHVYVCVLAQMDINVLLGVCDDLASNMSPEQICCPQYFFLFMPVHANLAIYRVSYRGSSF